MDVAVLVAMLRYDLQLENGSSSRRLWTLLRRRIADSIESQVGFRIEEVDALMQMVLEEQSCDGSGCITSDSF